MKEELQQAKKELEDLGDSILKQLPPVKSENSIEDLSNSVKRLQLFLDKFSKDATDKINEIVTSNEASLSENEITDFQSSLVKHTRLLIARYRNELL